MQILFHEYNFLYLVLIAVLVTWIDKTCQDVTEGTLSGETVPSR